MYGMYGIGLSLKMPLSLNMLQDKSSWAHLMPDLPSNTDKIKVNNACLMAFGTL